MKYLITGHPRSGTGYAAALFKANGFSVGHERMGKNGIASWQYPLGLQEFGHGKYTGKERFDKKIYLLRDPAHAVTSIAFTEQPSEDIRRIYVKMHGNMINRAAQSYIQWFYKYADGYDLMATEILCKLMNFDNDAPTDTNSRPHPFIPWWELIAFMDKDVARDFEDLAILHKHLLND